MTNTSPRRATQADDVFDWRQHLAVHPAAELFPPLPESELRELAKDNKAHGLQTPIVLWSPSSDRKVAHLLDGRHQLDALALLGLLWVRGRVEIF